MDGRTRSLPVRLTFAGVAQPCETLVTAAGPHGLTFETAVPVPDVALTLVSSYVGMPKTGTHVSHVAAAADGVTWTSHREALAGELPVQGGRRRCLLDHLAEVTDVLMTFGVSPAVQLGDELTFSLSD